MTILKNVQNSGYTSIADLIQADRNSNAVGSNITRLDYYDRRQENDCYENRSLNWAEPVPVVQDVVDTPTNRRILSGMQAVMNRNKNANFNYGLTPDYHYGNPAMQKPESERLKEMNYAEGFTLERKTEVVDVSSPVTWGPSLWLVLHTSAASYPEKPTPDTKDRMKQIINGLPLLVSCASCKEHCQALIDSNRNRLDEICGSKQNLFKFFVDFHNKVNKRQGKPEMSLKDAWAMYTGKARITYTKY